MYVTSPTRQYKWSGHPGRAVCPDGAHNYKTCQHSFGGGDDWRMFRGEVLWEHQFVPAPVHLFFGTLERRRAINAIAVRVMKETFPDVRIVDYEALTASLPTDYSIDGEHWGCRMDIWKARVCAVLVPLHAQSALSLSLLHLARRGSGSFRPTSARAWATQSCPTSSPMRSAMAVTCRSGTGNCHLWLAMIVVWWGRRLDYLRNPIHSTTHARTSRSCVKICGLSAAGCFLEY